MEKKKTSTNRYRNKLILLESFYWKCFRCGLDATIDNLPVWQFHHIDRLKKKYNVCSILSMSMVDFESCLSEIKRDCVMVCANCHAIITSDSFEREQIFNKWLSKRELSAKIREKIIQRGLME